MKIFHISDLHIGKQLYRYDLHEEQRDVLRQVILNIKKENPKVLIIAGDVFDKTMPSGDAYNLFDEFLENLSQFKDMKTLIIAGNHDSKDRLNYASGFMKKHNIIISTNIPKQGEFLEKIEIEDEYGIINFYLMPFVKPLNIKNNFGEDIRTYNEAVKYLLDRENIDYSKRNVLISHQFYIYGSQKPETSDSEQSNITVGGLDEVDASLVEKFDYVALGHIHRGQKVGKDYIRYSGTPLKYSVSEASHEKGITEVLLKGNNCEITKIKLNNKRDVLKLKGRLEELIDIINNDNYVSLTVTDADIQTGIKEKLQEKYSKILEIIIDSEEKNATLEELNENILDLNPLDAFEKFYESIKGKKMSQEEIEILKDVIETVSEGEVK